MNKALLTVTLVAVLCALLLGASMCGNTREAMRQVDWATGEERAERVAIENAALSEELRLKNEQLRVRTHQVQMLSEIETAAGIVLRVVAVLLLVALGVIGVYALVKVAALSFETWQRWTNTFYPDEAGVFPLMRLKIAGRWVVHDANRALTASTIYDTASAADSVKVIQVLESGMEGAQVQTSWNAQRVQAIAAAHRPQPTVTARSLPRQDGEPAAIDAPAQDVIMLPRQVRLLDIMPEYPSLNELLLGVTDNGGNLETVAGDMSQLVHVAVGGSSGWGKSVFLRSLAYQLATSREKPLLALIDLEGVTFSPFARCDRLLYPIADNEQDALAIYGALVEELDRRKELFSKLPGVDSLKAYNHQAREPLPAMVALTDEATALFGDKDVQGAAKTLALRGRKYGLWCVFGGQDWKATSIDSAIKNQLSARVHFKALNGAQSRVLLGRSDAEDIEVKGRAMAVLPGRGFVEMQTPFLSAKDVLRKWHNGAQPRRQMPQFETEDDREADRIKQLAAQGVSKRQICLELWDNDGGKYYDRVNAVLSRD